MDSLPYQTRFVIRGPLINMDGGSDLGSACVWGLQGSPRSLVQIGGLQPPISNMLTFVVDLI